MNRRNLTASMLAVAGLGVAALPAAAAEKPVPCDGVLQAKDAAGDQTVGFAGNQSPFAASENTDITGLFFVRQASGATTANFLMANLSKAPPPGSIGLVYRLYYAQAGIKQRLQADVDPTGTVTMTTATADENGLYATDGDVTGQFIEGKDGVISFDIPATAGAKTGVKFTDAYGFSAYDEGAVIAAADFAPDGDGRVTWNGATCGSAPAPAPAPAPTGPGGTPPVAPPPSGGPAPTGNDNRPVTTTGPLNVRVSPTSFKARKLKRARKLTLKLSSKEDIKELTAKLTTKKGATVGSGKLATVPAGPTTKLVLKIKRLKKGTYTLLLSGKRPDGSTGTVSVKLRVK